GSSHECCPPEPPRRPRPGIPRRIDPAMISSRRSKARPDAASRSSCRIARKKSIPSSFGLRAPGGGSRLCTVCAKFLENRPPIDGRGTLTIQHERRNPPFLGLDFRKCREVKQDEGGDPECVRIGELHPLRRTAVRGE